jgi:hypothetical protein
LFVVMGWSTPFQSESAFKKAIVVSNDRITYSLY